MLSTSNHRGFGAGSCTYSAFCSGEAKHSSILLTLLRSHCDHACEPDGVCDQKRNVACFRAGVDDKAKELRIRKDADPAETKGHANKRHNFRPKCIDSNCGKSEAGDLPEAPQSIWWLTDSWPETSAEQQADDLGDQNVASSAHTQKPRSVRAHFHCTAPIRKVQNLHSS
mmetsp:Transcript_35753/g.75088  ORF Transcript_35753/g.75088 Transcript_35753/m.75088 type:complete len:170 (-) Transcript_35753:342-851(-)